MIVRFPAQLNPDREVRVGGECAMMLQPITPRPSLGAASGQRAFNAQSIGAVGNQLLNIDRVDAENTTCRRRYHVRFRQPMQTAPIDGTEAAMEWVVAHNI